MTSIYRVVRGLSLVLTLAAMCATFGCSGSAPTGTVKGTIKLDGEAVNEGEVTAISTEGFGATTTIQGGSFEFTERFPVGEYTFTVGPPPLTQAPGEEGATAAPPSSNIPDGYVDDTQSDLVFTVAEGENSFDLQLKASGPSK